MSRRKSPAPEGALSLCAAAAAALLSSAGPALAEAAHAAASARVAIVEPVELKGVAELAPTRPGVTRPQLQVTIRAEPIPGDGAARRELVVVFD